MIYWQGMEGNGCYVIKVCPNQESVAQAAAHVFVEQFKIAMTRSEKFSVVLSGGKTPMSTYQLLATEPFKSQIDWLHVHVFWGDERCVPFDDMMSNYGSAQRAFLSQVPIPARQVHPILCTDSPGKSAKEYEANIRKYFDKSRPSFDLVFLGLGVDGHTASLFPNSSALDEKVTWVTNLKNEKENFARVSLTPQLLNCTHMALFMVTGRKKANILSRVLGGSETSTLLPAQLIQPVAGELLWLVDSNACPSG